MFVRVVKLANLLVVLLLFAKCANQRPPSGGPKDELGPTADIFFPRQNATFFKGRRIIISFSENIQAESVTQNLYFNPAYRGKYTHKIKGNKLQIDLEQPLLDTTTYQLFYASSVVDITERNKCADPPLTFSTGANLDTLYISGKVTDVITGEPISNAYVFLYNPDSANLQVNEPERQVKTAPDGTFLLQGCKPNNYRLFALLDLDNKRRYNFGERLAIWPDTLTINDTIKNKPLQLLMFRNDDQAPKYLRTKWKDFAFIAEFNEGLTQLIAIDSVSGKKLITQPTADKPSNFYIFNTLGYNDTTAITLTAIDSANNVCADTTIRIFVPKYEPDTLSRKITHIWKVDSALVKITDEYTKYDTVFAEKRTGKRKPEIKEITSRLTRDTIWDIDSTLLRIDTVYRTELFGISPPSGATLLPSDSVNFAFRHPVTQANINKIKVSVDSGTYMPICSKCFALHSNQTKGTLYLNYNYRRSVEFQFPDSTFFDVRGTSNSPVNIKYTFADENSYGIIRGKVSADYNQNLLLLTTEKGEVLKIIRNAQTYAFTNVAPGNYKLKLIIDRNGNGQHDLGSLKNNTTPENIIVYPAAITLKASWEVEGIDF